MKLVLSCLMKKAQMGLISKSLVDEMEQGITKLKMSASTPEAIGELEAAQFVYQQAQDRLRNKIAAVNVHADMVTAYKDRIADGLSRGMSYEQIVRAITLGDDADTFKFGSLGNSVRETIESYQNYFKSKALTAFKALEPKGFMHLTVDKDRQKDVIRALFEIQQTGSATSADAVVNDAAKVIDELHNLGGQMFKDMGGNITLTKGHALGDRSDPIKVAKLPFEDWVKVANQVYDRAFVAEAAPSLAKDNKLWYRALRDRYNNIVSGGLSDIGDYVPQGMRSVLNARNHHRLFRFKDADSYIMYHEQFGDLNLHSATMDYAESIGRDIGMMKTVGPRPQALENSIIRLIGEQAPEKANDIKSMFDRHMKYLTKSSQGSKDANLDKWLGTGTALNVAGKLGMTVVDAATVEKLGLSKLAGYFRGLPFLKTLADDLKIVFSSNKSKDKVYQSLAQQALHIDAYLDEAKNVLRTYTQEGGHRWARNAAHLVTKGTGLIGATNSTRAAAVRRMSMDIASKEWAQLNKRAVNYFTQLGIDEGVYNTIRQYGTREIDLGVNGVSVQALFDSGQADAAIALSKAAHRIVEASAPTVSHRALSGFHQLANTGKGGKLLSANFRTFMGYPMSFWDNHLRVMANMPGLGKQAGMVGGYTVLAATLGTAAVMIRDALNGKEPTLNLNTVARGMGRGVSLPLLGDFITSPDSGSFGGDLAKRALGVNLGIGASIVDAGIDLRNGKPSQATHELTQVMKGFMPGQNAPIIGLLMQRLMFDQLRYLYDPDASKAFNRTIKRAKKKGQEYYWAPGQTSPGVKE